MTRDFSDPTAITALYASLVRSILEYTSIAWCPYTHVWIERIESVQRKLSHYALRMLPWHDRSRLSPYESRCLLLGLETLSNRRKNAQALFVAGVLNRTIDAPRILEHINFHVPRVAARHRVFLPLDRGNTRYGENN